MFASELHQPSGQTNESVAPAKSLDAAGTFDTEPRPPRPRLFYLDNLRILLTVLVVLFHAAITYGNIQSGITPSRPGTLPGWPWTSWSCSTKRFSWAFSS
jgi:hypothetical protein